MKYIVTIAIGGAAGAVFRYSGSKYIMQIFNTTFPLGTLFVNALGSFIMGIAYIIFNKFTVSSAINSLITIGMLGAFTTMSTYCLETVSLLQDGEYKYMLLNILLNNMVSILAVILGIYSAKILLKIVT